MRAAPAIVLRRPGRTCVAADDRASSTVARSRINGGVAPLLCAALLVCSFTATAQTIPPASFSDDFQSYKTPSNPPGWVDSSVGSSMPNANGLYKAWPDPLQSSNVVYGTKQSSGKPDGRNPRIGTFSTLTTRTFGAQGRFQYRGRLLRTDSDTRIGLTFFSAYPQSDSYYLVGLWQQASSTKLTMQLFSAAGSAGGTVDSGFTPPVNRWIRFLIQADDAGQGETRIRARFWPDGEAEPSTFSIDATDSAATRLVSGRIGVWSAVRGDAYFDDFSAKSPVDQNAPSIAFFESGNALDPKELALFGRDAKIEIRVTDATPVTTAATLDGAPYSSLDPITAEGAHTLRVHAVNAAGNAADAELKLIVDKSPPQVTVSESGKPLASGSLFNRSIVPLITASDLTAVKLTATVDGLAYTIGTAIGADGPHTLVVRAEDSVGFVTNVPPIVFTIDQTPPRVTFISPAAGSTIATAHSVVTGDADDAVSVTINGAPAAIDAAKKFATAKPLDFTEGENSVVAVALDKAGNSATVISKFTVDTQPPVVSIDSPAAKACVDASALEVRGQISDLSTATTVLGNGSVSVTATVAADKRSWSATLPVDREGALSITATATDVVGHRAAVVVPITIDRTKPRVEVLESGAPFEGAVISHAIALFIRAIDADPTASVTARLDDVPYVSGSAITAEARHELRVTATDCAGHVSDEKVVAFTIDLTPPRITNITPPNGATVGERPVVTGTVPADCVRVAIDGSDLGATISAGTFSFAALPFDEGRNDFTFVAVDSAGNQSRFEYSLTLRTASPFITITESGSAIPPAAVYRRSVTPVIQTSGPASTISATLNGAPFSSGTTITVDGDYVLSATAADSFGHSMTVTAGFGIDRTPPALTVSVPVAGATIRTDHAEVSGSAAATDLLSVTVNGFAAAVAAGGAFTVSVPLEAGPNELLVVAADRHGNSASVSIPVTRDDGRLALLLLTPADGSLTNKPSVTVAGQLLQLVDGAHVTVNGREVAVDAAGIFRLPGLPLAAGVNTIVAAVRTPIGSTSEVSARVTADFSAPSVKLLANGAELSNGMRFAVAPSITIEASDPNGATLSCTLDGSRVAPPIGAVGDGAHALTVVARDAAGNESRIDRTFVVGDASSGGCQIGGFDPTDKSAVYGETVRITGRASGASNVIVAGTRAQFADGSFCGTVAMQPGRNDIRIDCADANGLPTGTSSVLTLYRYTDTTIVITSPSTGAVSAAPKVTISGTVGPGVTGGDVNGLAFTIVDDGAASHPFAVENVPLVNGLNVITARARTSSGRIALTNVRVKYFGAAPAMAITSPLPATQTRSSAIDVSGVYENVDPSTIVATVGSSTFPATVRPHGDTSGVFVVPAVAVARGVQIVTVTGRSRGGTTAAAAVSIEGSAAAASIAITSPPDNSSYGSSVTQPPAVAGTASPADGALLQVNGVPAAVDPNGSFTARAEFSGTVTPIVARVTTPDGATAVDVVRIVRFAKPFAVSDSYPSANASGIDPGVLLLLLLANPVDGTTAASSLRLADATGSTVDGEVFVDKETISFAPVHPLTPGATYTFSAATTLKDIAGDSLATPWSGTFSVAGSAPTSAPQLDQQDAAGCFARSVVSGHASVAGARLRLEVDGVTMTASAASDRSFRFEFTLSGRSGFHLARVREVGADGTLSPDASVSFRVNCTVPQVLSASLDRSAKVLVIGFSKPVNPSTLTSGAAGTVQLSAAGSPALAGTISMNAASDTATVALSGDLPQAALTLVVTKGVQDLDGIGMGADYVQAFPLSGDDGGASGEGYITGVVIDASSGRPLPGAQIDIAAPLNAFAMPGRPAAAARSIPIAFAAGPATTNERGRYTRPVAEGVYTVTATAPGFTTVWRQVVVSAGAGSIPIDVRLTPIGVEQIFSGASVTLHHGGDSLATRAVELSVPSTSLAPGERIALTSAGTQALAGLLPLGWSAVAAAEIAVDGSAVSAPLPAAKLTFTLGIDEVAALTAAGQTFSLVQYEPDRDEWRTIAAVASVDAQRAATFDIASSGGYALVYPDKSAGVVRPLPARTGAALQGVEDPCDAHPEVCTAVSRSFVLTPDQVLPNGRTTAVLTVDATKPFPSGTAVQATIDEQLNLADGRVVNDPPFTADLLLYRTISGDAATAIFHLQPSSQAALAMLRDGVDRIRISEFPGRVDRGSIVGSEGGRVSADDTVTIDVPPGAASEPLHVNAAAMTSSEIAAVGPIAGFRIAAGFTLTLSRIDDATVSDVTSSSPELAKSARGTFAIEAAADAQVIVAECVDRTPFGPLVRLASLTLPIASTAASNVRTFTTRAIDPATLPLDGIVRNGRYLVLVANAPIAFAFGEVRSGAAGVPISSARVTSGTGVPQAAALGVMDLTRPGGVFALPVAAKPAAVFSLLPRSAAAGDGQALASTKNPERDELVDFGVLPLVTLPPQLKSIAPADGSVLNANEPLSIQATFDSALDPTSAGGAIVVTNSVSGAAVAGTCSIAGAVITFTPASALAPAASYAITVSPAVRGLSGTPFGQTAVARFTTRAIPQGDTSIHPELIRITLPVDGRCVIRGAAGALPAGSQAVAVRRGTYFVIPYQATVAADGFSFSAGNPGVDAIVTTDAIDLQVVDAVSRAIIAVIPLTPFVTADGNGFLAPVDTTTRFTTAGGLTITVPAGAFAEPTVVTATIGTKAPFAAVRSFDHDLEYATSVDVEFEGIARKRLDVELPIPADLDVSNRTFYLGYLGNSARGPRVMIVDTLLAKDRKFSTALDSSAAGTSVVALSKPQTAAVGADLKNALLGITRKGTYAAVSFLTGSASLAWGVIEGLQSGSDLFWTGFDALYAASFYLTESRGTIAIPLLNNKQKFEIVGVDAATGLTAFTKVYDPLPDGDPGATVIVANPNPEKEGPYPVFGTPFRIETLVVDPGETMSVRNFDLKLSGGMIHAVDSAEALPPNLGVALFNGGTGHLDAKRSDGLQVIGSEGDRLALFIEQTDVDPYTPLSVVFSKKIYTGGSEDDGQVHSYLEKQFTLKSSRNPDVEPFQPVAGVRYSVDSGGRRVLLSLPASLQRGYGYELVISKEVADCTGPGDGPGLFAGEAVLADGKTGAQAFVLRFRVRTPGGKLNSFDVATGEIRDEALNGNVLLVAALDGGVLAYDVADPASTGSGSLLGVAQLGESDAWAVASDHHGRVYATGLSSLFGYVRSFRLEDFLPDATHPAPRHALQRGSGIVSFAPGAAVNMPISSGTVLSDRPEAIPRKLQILLQDREESFASLSDLKKTPTASVTKSGDDGEFEILTADIARDADLPYAGQRVTVENLTLDLRWSADAHQNTKAHIEGIIGRKDDRFRIIHNRMTYGLISLFGFGIGVYDLNAIESNDDIQPPVGYKAMREVVRVTSARLGAECGWGSATKPIPQGAIPNLEFTPDAAIVTRDGTPDLFVYGIDPARGILDVRIHPPVTQAESMLPADSSLCDERPPIGLVLQNASPGDGTAPAYEKRIAALRAAFKALTNRNPVGRFTGVSYYSWTLEAKDNKAVAPAAADGTPALGLRQSIAGQRVVRDYLLVPGFELGVLIFEIGGQPGPVKLAAGYSPLMASHLVDIIWIPSGAYAVRAIPRSNLATVVDGEGRVLLVDLARIDERFDGKGASIAEGALFATAASCLAANGAYGVGLPDPRIVWQSDPQPDAITTLAPLIDAATGMVYRGRLLKKSTDVIAAVDPKIEMKCDLAQPGGLSAVGGVVPLGIVPPAAISALIATGDPARKANASAAAFRLELALPGAIADALSKSGNKVRLAVESEIVAGSTAAQTPDGFPRAHLRQTTRSGDGDVRAASGFELRRVVPPTQAARLRAQKGYNRFISPWIVAVADPRAAAAYEWSFPAGVTDPAAQDAWKAATGCFSCTRPAALVGKTEQNDVWEIQSNGRLLAVRPDFCSGNCSSNLFTGTAYAYLGGQDRLFSRFATIPADVVRPKATLVAAQNPPVAPGLLQDTTYLHSGEVEVRNTDFDFGGRNGWNVSIDRTYRSRSLGATPFGAGWESTLFRRLRVLPSGEVEYRDGAGEMWLFRVNGTGYASPSGLFLRLARNERGWRLSDQKHRVTGFDSLGRIVYEADEFTKNPDVSDNGNVIRYLYDAGGRLARVIDPVGRVTTLTYFGDGDGTRAGLIKRIADWRSRSIDYDYDAAGRLTTVLLPDVVNTSGARPAIHYAYAPYAAGWNDKLEIAPNLTAVVDPGAPTPRVSFVYGADVNTRDKVIRQEWSSTGELATFQYDSSVQVTTIDALGQTRVVKLTAAEAVDAAADRVHLESIEERDVATSTVAFGELPLTTTAGPLRGVLTRTIAFTHADGLLAAADLSGVAKTTYKYKPAEGGLGVLTDSTEVVPATAAGGTKLTRAVEYQSGTIGTDVSAFLKSVTANGAKIETPEPSPLPSVTASNDSVTRTTEMDAAGRPVHITTVGGTDGANIGSDAAFEYVPSTGPLHSIGKLKKVTRRDGTESLSSEIVYESADTTTEYDERGVATITKVDAWDRPVDVTLKGKDGTIAAHQQYEYDAAGRVKRQHRDQSGNLLTTEYEYDALGRTVASTIHKAEVGGEPKSLTTKTSYDLSKRLIVHTDPTTATTTQLLDGLGRTQSRTTAAGTAIIIEEYAYDAAGNQVFAGEKCSTCGGAQWVGTASSFDAHGRSTATVNADGSKSVSSGFDGWGNPQSVKQYDSLNSVTGTSSFDFSPTGRLRSDSTDLGTKARQSDYRWDGAGRSTISATSGRASETRFDALGRLKSTKSGEGSATGVANAVNSYEVPSTGYAGALVVAASSREKGTPPVPAAYTYDAAARKTSEKVGALEWKQEFDQVGNVRSASDPGRPATQFDYDSRGLLTRETRADSSKLEHQHDAAGSVSSYADPLETTTTENDLLGRPVIRHYPDGTTEKFEYEGSRLASYVDRQARSFHYTYDQAGRLHEVRAAGGALLEQRDYDSAGRLQLLTTAGAAIRYDNFDLGGRPHLTRQTRYKEQSGFTSKVVLDEYSQTHDYNEHGERTSFTLPYSGTAAGWTTSVDLSYDVAGNVTQLKRTLSGSAVPAVLLSAEYRSSGRPVHRDLTTDCAAAAACTSASILRQYAYDDAGAGQMNELKVIARGNVVAGSHLTYDGLQLKRAELLGISGPRVNEFTYDERSRLKTSAFGKPAGSAAAEEKLEPFDFRTALDRPKGTPADPASMTFAHAPGHKIASVTQNGATRVFSYGAGAERIDDGRFTYEYDLRGRLVRATEKGEDNNPKRRITYEYSATDRIVGRLAEYTTVATPLPAEWKLEDRSAILDADALPADTTFIWDPISDQLVALARAGAAGGAAPPASDANGGMLRQIIHGGLAYDDPLEVTIADPSGVQRLYPIFEAAGSLQAIVNANGEVVSRSVMQGAYGEDTVSLDGVAIDRIAIRASRDMSGSISSVEVTMRATEPLAANTVATGVRLASVTADGTLVRTTAVVPKLHGSDTIAWTLTPSEWSQLIDSTPVVVNGIGLTASQLSIAATNTLRSSAWSASQPILPAPEWAVQTQPIFTSAALPVEARQSIAALTAQLGSTGANTQQTVTPYDVAALSALSSAVPMSPDHLLPTAPFQALPFAEPVTGLLFARARWLNPKSGGFLSPDPMGYRDSANLYAYCAGDPVNGRDPTGLYEEDVHHYLTWFLARAAGFDAETAEWIGYHTQQLDMDEREAMYRGTNPKNMRDFHMVTPQRLADLQREAVKVLGTGWWDDPASTSDVQMSQSLKWQSVGNYLHALEDSFSHQKGEYVRDFRTTYSHGLEKVIGHAVKRHTADWTWDRPELGIRMARTTFNEMRKLCAAAQRDCAGYDWQEIEASVREFIRYKPPTSEMTGQVMFGMPVANVLTYQPKVNALVLPDGFRMTVTDPDRQMREKAHQDFIEWSRQQQQDAVRTRW